MPFDKLYQGLRENVDAGFINWKQYPNGLELFDYNKQCTFAKQWNEFTIAARGLILAPQEKRIAALTFPKFFNFGEVAEKLPQLPFTTTTKYDGSMGIAFFYQGEWHVSTRGSMESDQAKWATAWLRSHLDKLSTPMLESHTYLFEIIYPENKIVIDYYGWQGLVLLGGYDNTNGCERTLLQLCWPFVREYLGLHVEGFEVASEHFHSIEQLFDLCKQMSHQSEGFVVRYDNGYRVKIKGDEYCRVHKLISRVTPIAIWEAMYSGLNLEDFKVQLPEEFYADFDNIRNLIDNQVEDIYQKNYECFQEIGFNNPDHDIARDRKSFALNVQDCLGDKKIRKDILFLMYDHKSESEIRKKILYGLRPTGNILSGYTPSSSMNNIQEEE